MIESLLTDALFAAFAGMGFGIAFNPHFKKLLIAGLLAAIGHSFRLWLMTGCSVNICAATFAGALLIGIGGFIAGRILGCPSEVFTFPAVLPMIPGLFAYKTILSAIKFIETNTTGSPSTGYLTDFLSNGIISSSIMFAIVLGASVSVFVDTLSSRIENRKMLSGIRPFRHKNS